MSVLFSGPSPHGSLRCAVPAVSGAGHDSDAQGRPDQQFVAMLNTYRSNGGLARAEEVLTIFGHAPGFDVATLARWIIERQVISFEWEAETWFPFFQLDRVNMTIRHGLKTVLAELDGVYDEWELAQWFARPNSSLQELSPAEVFISDRDANLSVVLHAARIDRFAALG